MTKHLALLLVITLSLLGCRPHRATDAWAGQCYVITWRDSQTASALPSNIVLDARPDSANFGAAAPMYLLRPAQKDTALWVGLTVATWAPFGPDSLALGFLRAGAGWLTRL